MRTLLHMKYLVYSKSTRLTKSFPAFRALERFLFRVNVSVISQMILSSERFTTNITRIWSFISVSSLMDQKIVGFSKFTVTELTDKPFLGSCRSPWSTEETRIVGRIGWNLGVGRHPVPHQHTVVQLGEEG